MKDAFDAARPRGLLLDLIGGILEARLITVSLCEMEEV